MNDLTSQSIKGYELKERIGAGGFGAVYRAHQSTVGREVAIKIILPGLANQPDFIRRFEIEAQLVARLDDGQAGRAGGLGGDLAGRDGRHLARLDRLGGALARGGRRGQCCHRSESARRRPGPASRRSARVRTAHACPDRSRVPPPTRRASPRCTRRGDGPDRDRARRSRRTRSRSGRSSCRRDRRSNWLRRR